MFLILLHYKQPLTENLPKIDACLAAHRAFLDKHYQTGALIMSGPAIPREKGIIISKHKTREEVNIMIQDDPFYKEGLAAYEIIEFNAVKHVPEIARLIQ